MVTKQLVLEYENKYIIALLGNDIFALEGLLHDDMLINNLDGHAVTKAMNTDELRSGVLRIIDYKPGDHVISIIDDVAVVSLSVYFEATMAGNAMSLDLKILRVWKESGDGLKIVAMSEMPKNLSGD